MLFSIFLKIPKKNLSKMPNSRRRKFSVQNDVTRKNTSKGGTSSATRNLSPTRLPPNSSHKYNKTTKKNFPNQFAGVEPMGVVLESDECSSNSLVQKVEINEPPDFINQKSGHLNTATESVRSSHSLPKLTSRQLKHETMEKSRLEKSYQHCARICSQCPQHSLLIMQSPILGPKHEDIATYVDVGVDSCMETVGTNVIDWAQETQDWSQEIHVYTVNAQEVETFELEQPSDHSFGDMCRICHSGDCLSPELGRLVSACSCRGTVGRVHVRCLERWLTESGKSRCELCGTRYTTRRVHRYGVPKALVMWFLSQNAKQLMVDSLGIMLMSPLAVLAAWLSGRTLAGLMTQESQVTPWPLASTFVLACMTLVCYYCWIVSAATRHALGWWIWYRSQYEVRLELQDED